MNEPKLANQNEAILVDDDEMQHLIVESYFQKSPIKNPLLMFQSGAAFLDYLENVKAGKNRMPAIILLDLSMPFIDGFEILKKIREDGKFQEIPVILILSTSDAPSDVDKAIALGANGFQTKPIGKKGFETFFKSLMPD